VDTSEPGDLRATAIRSALWVAVQKWGNTISSLVVFTLLGRLLEPSAIGLAALAMVFIGFFQVLYDQGFSTALIQKHSIRRSDQDAAFWMTFGTATLLVALIVTLSPVASAVFHQPEFGPVLIGLSPMLVMGSLAGVPEAMLERDFQFRSLTLRTLFGSVTGGVAGVTCAVLGANVWSLVVQALTTSFVSLVFVWRVSAWRPSFHFERASARGLRSTGLSVLGVQLVGMINAQGDKLIVGAILGPADLGYYYVGTRIITILTDVQTSVIESISLTTLSRLQKNRERLRTAFYKLTSLGAASAIAAFAVVAATANVIIPLVFGPSWAPTTPIMQILCLMGCLNAIIVFDRNALIATGAARAALMITIAQCVVGLVAVAVAVPFGVLAVALAVVGRQYLMWPFRLKVVRDAIGISLKRYLLNWLGPMCSGVVVFAAGVTTNLLWRPSDSTLPQLLYLAAFALIGLVLYSAILRVTSRTAYDDFADVLRNVVTRSPLRRRDRYRTQEP
jgi:teichuronic acid exporter